VEKRVVYSCVRRSEVQEFGVACSELMVIPKMTPPTAIATYARGPSVKWPKAMRQHEIRVRMTASFLVKFMIKPFFYANLLEKIRTGKTSKLSITLKPAWILGFLKK
jgi:hypothetical protein